MTSSIEDLDRQRFNHWAETYERSYLQWLLFDRVHQAILKQVPPGFVPAMVLDIGCGTGRLLRRMHTQWPDASLVGIDLSDGMAARAHRFDPFAAISQAPAERLPLRTASVDLVTSSVSFHHWTNQEQGIAEIARVISRNGLLILADTNIGHGKSLSRRQVRELIQSSGLSVRRQVNFLPFFAVTSAGRK